MEFLRFTEHLHKITNIITLYKEEGSLMQR
jgi:hypothetical protein